MVSKTQARRLVPKLLRAINAHDLEQVRAVLDEGADPSGVGGFNATPLRTATAIFDDGAGREAITRLLLERGADPNDKGPYGFDNRPIFYATHCGYEEVVRMLLEAGGFPRDDAGAPAVQSEGTSLLFPAASSGLRWLITRCLDEGCDVRARDRSGQTVLHRGCSTHLVDTPRAKDVAAVLTQLLDAGAETNVCAQGGLGTAMHAAAGYGDAAAVRTLFARGEGLNPVTVDGAQHPLHVGARGGPTETVEALLDLGAPVDVRDALGRTPLHHAAERGADPRSSSRTMLALLIERGADVGARDAQGQTPYEAAAAFQKRLSKKLYPPNAAQAEAMAFLKAAHV